MEMEWGVSLVRLAIVNPVVDVPALTAEQVLGDALSVHAREQVLLRRGQRGHRRPAGRSGRAARRPGHRDGWPGRSRPRVTALGARHVIDYHDQDWPAQVRALSANRGVDAAANAVPGGAASAIRAVAGGGRLATITSDPPGEQRGITVSSIYVRPDGNQMRELATRFADGQLEIPVADRYRLADAAQALARKRAATPPEQSSSRPDPNPGKNWQMLARRTTMPH